MKLVSPPPDERALVLNWLAQRIAVANVRPIFSTKLNLTHQRRKERVL